MRMAREFVISTVAGGMLVVVPVYLAVLLVVTGMQSVAGVAHPIAILLPDWLPAEDLISLIVVIGACFIVGVAVRTGPGQALRERLEALFFRRLPGYHLFRGLTQRVAGDAGDNAWKPALVEIEEALVPAFVVEELDDGRLTVFVPSVPTLFAGAVYIIGPHRVHLLDVPFTQAIQAISRWGSGSKDLVASMSHRSPQ